MNAISSKIPHRYGWRFKTADAFNQERLELRERTTNPEKINSLYWLDVLATIESYGVTAAWRMVDISQSAFRAFEQESVIPGAILSRAALESAIQFVYDARTFSATLGEVCKANLRTQEHQSTDLEMHILKTIYASRQTGVAEFYTSINILTVIDKISKIASTDPLKDQYETLCEVTHPNFLGRSMYIVDAEPGPRTGDELRIVSPDNGPISATVLRSALWALSWSLGAQMSATQLLWEGIRSMFATFPFLEVAQTIREKSDPTVH